jgi:hypothetical protein
MNKQTKETHWVLAYGRDCDGHNSGQVYAFITKQKAEDFANYLSGGSDGLQYEVTDSWSDVEEYCDDYNKDSSRYKTITT